MTTLIINDNKDQFRLLNQGELNSWLSGSKKMLAQSWFPGITLESWRLNSSNPSLDGVRGEFEVNAFSHAIPEEFQIKKPGK